MVKLSPTVTDCGAGSKIVVRQQNGNNVSDPVVYTSNIVVPVTLGSSSEWTSNYMTYDVYAVDNVGNETMLKTYKFRAYTTSPTSQTKDAGYNKLAGKIKWNSADVKALNQCAKASGTINVVDVEGQAGYEENKISWDWW